MTVSVDTDLDAPAATEPTQPCLEPRPRRRIAFIASHPVQYVVPLYRRLARRDDVTIKVFYTWHAGGDAILDREFGQTIAWDIPLTEGYELEAVPNTSARPGPYGFFGLRNPTLVARVMAWRPDVVHVAGWAWLSHLHALWAFRRLDVPTLFRGDSHLLDPVSAGPRWWLKQAMLRRVFSWPSGFLVVGSANRAYYERFGVARPRLYPCPHSIDVARFAEPAQTLEQEAARWRLALGIAADKKIALFAGKFVPDKRPLELMRAVQRLADPDLVLVLVGAGALQPQIDALAAADPGRFRVLPFQNQSRMPLVYRLGDLFVYPSRRHETWGLAVNEALACGRPVLVGDRVGCTADVVDPGCGMVFPTDDLVALEQTLAALVHHGELTSGMRRAAAERARLFDIAATEAALVCASEAVCAP